MRWILTLSSLAAVASLRAAEPAKLEPAAVEQFEKSVRPLLVEHCTRCHGEKKQQGALRLDTAAGFRNGNDGDPILDPKKPEDGRFVRSVTRTGDYAMPPDKPLPPEAVAVLVAWAKAGAPYPEGEAAQADPKAAAEKHWAFQPVKEVAPPKSASRPELESPIDRHLLAKLEPQGLTFAPVADPRTRLRRLSIDLIGLPPTAAELDAFAADPSPAAWERAVDRLLASPQYGERWARHWLDLARYADSKGYVFQEERAYPFAYTYRDYVIRTLNEDKPYRQFVAEQLAADLIAKAKPDADPRNLAAMGFLTVGRRFSNNVADIIDDRIDVVTRTFLGLTVQCARCHDHKFDPIPAADYYSLYGVFESSEEPKELPVIGPADQGPVGQKFEADLAKRRQDLADYRVKRHADILAELNTAASVAKYLRFVTPTVDKPDGAANEVRRAQQLRNAAFQSWREYLKAKAKAGGPEWGVWFAVASKPDGEVEATLQKLLADDAAKPVNPAVKAALLAAKPKTVEAVAAAFAKLLAEARDAKEPAADLKPLQAVLGPTGPTAVPFAKVDLLFDRADRDKQTEIQKKIDAFVAKSPAAPPRAMVMVDRPSPSEPVIFLRGNPESRGPKVPRRAPQVIDPKRVPFKSGSGRLELAEAIADPNNPLTARVLVNRVWGHHFGKPLVATPSDFGLRSEPPTHPELLDYLAAQFVRDGGSLKTLHRRILLTAAYQQSSAADAKATKLDPENRLLSHANRRRLDFEALRDSLLFVAGRLDATVYGRSVELFANPSPPRRSVYASIDRQNLAGTFRAFDFASPDAHSPQRFQTTVPQQALFLMNSPFLAQQAKAVNARPEVVWCFSAAERVRRLNRAVLGRDPTAAEAELGTAFIAQTRGEAGGKPLSAWELYAQVLLLSNEFAFVD